MVKILKIIGIIICNILYSLCLEVYWLAYYGMIYASGSIVFADSKRRIIWNLTPVFVVLVAALGILLNIFLFKKKWINGNKEKKWVVVLIVGIIILSVPAIIGLANFIEYMIYGDEIWM